MLYCALNHFQNSAVTQSSPLSCFRHSIPNFNPPFFLGTVVLFFPLRCRQFSVNEFAIWFMHVFISTLLFGQNQAPVVGLLRLGFYWGFASLIKSTVNFKFHWFKYVQQLVIDWDVLVFVHWFCQLHSIFIVRIKWKCFMRIIYHNLAHPNCEEDTVPLGIVLPNRYILMGLASSRLAHLMIG